MRLLYGKGAQCVTNPQARVAGPFLSSRAYPGVSAWSGVCQILYGCLARSKSPIYAYIYLWYNKSTMEVVADSAANLHRILPRAAGARIY